MNMMYQIKTKSPFKINDDSDTFDNSSRINLFSKALQNKKNNEKDFARINKQNQNQISNKQKKTLGCPSPNHLTKIDFTCNQILQKQDQLLCDQILLQPNTDLLLCDEVLRQQQPQMKKQKSNNSNANLLKYANIKQSQLAQWPVAQIPAIDSNDMIYKRTKQVLQSYMMKFKQYVDALQQKQKENQRLRKRIEYLEKDKY